MLIDIGLNLTSDAFGDDRQAVVARARDAGVEMMIITGTDVDHSRAGITQAQAYPGVLYSTVGIHPHHAGTATTDTLQILHRLAQTECVRALGECGLDYNRQFSSRREQLYCFERQLELAATLGMPVFLHQRDAHEDFVALLGRYRDRLPAAVAHCFTGGDDELAAYLDMDLHIGITGWICDERRGQALQRSVRNIPLDRLMLESDAPYLLPRDLRPRPKSGRNEPMYLPHICASVGAYMGCAPDVVAAATSATAMAFFQLSPAAAVPRL